jgi:hypothetical protein
MTKATFLAAALLTAIAAHADDQDMVWVWNSQCAAPTRVVLRVRLDGKKVYSTSIPLCLWSRKLDDGKASFTFTPSKKLVWYGYRSYTTEDLGDPIPAGTALTVNFWQAGGETDTIELGYSVEARDGIHMNSVHLLSPISVRTTTMAPGLVLETRPEKKHLSGL